MQSKLRLRALAGLLVLAFGLAACGDGNEEPAGEESTEESTETAAGAELEITGVDYAFQDVPETIEAGTKLTFANASEKEAHEMAVVFIPESETRTLDELLALPPEESQQAVQFRGVGVALPGEEAFYPEGDIVVEEPGRYAMVCFIPVGADVEALKAAMQAPEGQEGPPDMGDGPPHFTQGMKAEFTVS